MDLPESGGAFGPLLVVSNANDTIRALDPATQALGPALQLGAGEGLAFVATTDDAGSLLDGTCTYVLSGTTPPARLWTLTAYDSAGRLVVTATGRATLTSREILRHGDRSFDITAAQSVQPGNWLPTTSSRVSLVLRLYDTALTSPARPTTLSMPTIHKGTCR